MSILHVHPAWYAFTRYADVEALNPSALRMQELKQPLMWATPAEMT